MTRETNKNKNNKNKDKDTNIILLSEDEYLKNFCIWVEKFNNVKI